MKQQSTYRHVHSLRHIIINPNKLVHVLTPIQICPFTKTQHHHKSEQTRPCSYSLFLCAYRRDSKYMDQFYSLFVFPDSERTQEATEL